MKFNRILVVCILAIIPCEGSISDYSLLPHPPRRSLLFFPPFISVPKPPANNNKPFSIFSRPAPEKDDEPHKGQTEGGIIAHVGNVLHGGSIGIEIRPLAPLQGIFDHAKKFIPGHGTVGRPSHERPDYGQPNKDQPHYERPHYEHPNKHERPPYHERPNKEHNPYERPHHQRPGYQRPNTDRPKPPNKEENNEEWEETHKKPEPGPQWEDIGEVPSGEEDEYGVGVLQPRTRPKRFVESKIYHVPLLFRSNGRADRVRIKGRNGLRERKNSDD